MNIHLNTDPTTEDITVSITCPYLTPQIEKLMAAIRMLDHQLSVKKGKETFLLDLSDIIYMESIDRTCFVYTQDDVYESSFKLYELEEQLSEYGFCRIAKACLIHMRHIRSLKADINHKIRITMSNGEALIASRQYAESLKKRLGVI